MSLVTLSISIRKIKINEKCWKRCWFMSSSGNIQSLHVVRTWFAWRGKNRWCDWRDKPQFEFSWSIRGWKGLDSEIITHISVCICSLLSRKFMFSFLYSAFIIISSSSTAIITVIITTIILRMIQYLNHITAFENARRLSLLHSSNVATSQLLLLLLLTTSSSSSSRSRSSSSRSSSDKVVAVTWVKQHGLNNL